MELYEKIKTNAPEDTERVGRELAEKLLSDRSLPRFVALEGDLGVGKTVFVRGFTSAVAPSAAVRSPTFALVNEYREKNAKISLPIYHFDVYRIEDEDDLYSIGFYDYLDQNAICLVEWSENIRYAFPDSYFTVRIEKDDLSTPESRLVSIFLTK